MMRGKVVSVMDFGAFVSIGDKMDGLVHISQLQEARTNAVTDVVTIGQEVRRAARGDAARLLGWCAPRESAGARVAEGTRRGGESGQRASRQVDETSKGSEPDTACACALACLSGGKQPEREGAARRSEGVCPRRASSERHRRQAWRVAGSNARATATLSASLLTRFGGWAPGASY
jgi:hypothetical protein